MALSTLPYKGSRDYYPQDKRLQDYIFSTWRNVVELFGYEEYSAPLLESIEIYSAKSGQEIVNEQTYSFTDRGGRAVAIRPEMTPSISRMVAARRQELAVPARLYSIANFMRYERPQHGREREFWQLNTDIFGVSNILAEVEMIQMAHRLLHAFGAHDDDFSIAINDRTLINFIMASYLGLEKAEGYAMTKLLDRRDKLPPEIFEEQATQIFNDGAVDGGYEKLRTLLDAQTMADLPAEIRESEAVASIRSLFTLLKEAGVNNAKFDITLMRGLDYYTGIVFEVFDTNPENKRSLFGGGRYDGLVGLFGVEPIATVGMALGATTMEDFLRAHDLIPELGSHTHVGIIALGDTLRASLKIAEALRAQGLRVEVDLTGRKIEKQIRALEKKAIRYALFIGEEEVTSGHYTLRDIVSGNEQKLELEEIPSAIKTL